MFAKTLLVGGWTTHLKNMLVKLDHFPRDRDEHKNNLKPPPSLGPNPVVTSTQSSPFLLPYPKTAQKTHRPKHFSLRPPKNYQFLFVGPFLLPRIQNGRSESLKVDSTFQTKTWPKKTSAALRAKHPWAKVFFWARNFPNVFLFGSLVGCIQTNAKENGWFSAPIILPPSVAFPVFTDKSWIKLLDEQFNPNRKPPPFLS